MEINKQLGLSGSWLVANCGKFPSDMNCKLVMMAPESQRKDFIEAAVAHAVKSHGHTDSKELRQEFDKFVEVVKM